MLKLMIEIFLSFKFLFDVFLVAEGVQFNYEVYKYWK